jgi:hypothetical protein
VTLFGFILHCLVKLYALQSSLILQEAQAAVLEIDRLKALLSSEQSQD